MEKNIGDKYVKGVSISNDEKYERQPLASIVPLDWPLAVEIGPITSCNFKCVFCGYSSESEGENPYGHLMGKKMTYETFKKVIDDLKEKSNGRKVKALHFCGFGEPLLHNRLENMVAYGKQAGIAEKIDIVTNGVLLKPERSKALVDAGIDFIRISVNGLSDEDFFRNTQVKVDFKDYVDQIKCLYTYSRERNTRIYIKILDYMVNTEEKKAFFYKTFEPYCDSINIEYYNQSFAETKASGILEDTNLNHRGERSTAAKCCSQPFFKLIITPDGFISPCSGVCSNPNFPLIYGNVNDENLITVFQSGKGLNKFRRKILKSGIKGGNMVPICEKCYCMKLISCEADNIDSEAERLLNYYREDT